MTVLPFKQIRTAATNALRVPLHAGTSLRPAFIQKKKAARKPLCRRKLPAVKTYLAGAGVVDEPDAESEGAVPDEPDEDDFDFFAFLCFFDFLAFGWVSVPAAPLAPVSDAPELADGLVELAPLVAPDMPDVPEVPDAPEVSLAEPGLVPVALLPELGEVALLPEVPDVPELPEVSLLMPEDEVPLDPDDGDEGDDDMLLPVSFELELEGEVALLPLVSAPVPWASATEDTDATRTNDNDWIVVFNVMSNSLGWKKGIIDAAAWMRSMQARSPARRRRYAKFRQIFSSPLKSKDFLTM